MPRLIKVNMPVATSSVEGVFGGFTIAHDWNGTTPEILRSRIIEDATGGAVDDRLIGNMASNRLRGRKGDDFSMAVAVAAMS